MSEPSAERAFNSRGSPTMHAGEKLLTVLELALTFAAVPIDRKSVSRAVEKLR
jgi:hypothetical protein